jgi:tetratricopeptide (TPR) repeat protein
MFLVSAETYAAASAAMTLGIQKRDPSEIDIGAGLVRTGTELWNVAMLFLRDYDAKHPGIPLPGVYTHRAGDQHLAQQCRLCGNALYFDGDHQKCVNEDCIKTREHDAVYKKGYDLIYPHLIFGFWIVARLTTIADQEEVLEGIESLNRALELRPDNWPALWWRGKAYQALQEHESAYESFLALHVVDPKQPDVGSELCFECLMLDRNAEALEVADATWRSKPEDACCLANLAAAQLLNGEIDKAVQNIGDALGLDPIIEDPDYIFRKLQTTFKEVQSGLRPRPQRFDDLF